MNGGIDDGAPGGVDHGAGHGAVEQQADIGSLLISGGERHGLEGRREAFGVSYHRGASGRKPVELVLPLLKKAAADRGLTS